MSGLDKESLSFELPLWLVRREMGLVEVASWRWVGASWCLASLKRFFCFVYRNRFLLYLVLYFEAELPRKNELRS